jgi:predicted transcriptional regulator
MKPHKYRSLFFLCGDEYLNVGMINNFLKDKDQIQQIIYCNNFNHTPLMHMCCNRNISVELLDCLIQKFTDTGERTKYMSKFSTYNISGLGFLCNNYNITYEVFKHYIDNLNLSKTDLNLFLTTPDEWGGTNLMKLCGNKNLTFDIFKYYVDNITDYDYINIRDKNQSNVFFKICNNGFIDNKLIFIKYIKKHIKDIDSEINILNFYSCIKKSEKELIIQELNEIDSPCKSAAKTN